MGALGVVGLFGVPVVGGVVGAGVVGGGGGEVNGEIGFVMLPEIHVINN